MKVLEFLSKTLLEHDRKYHLNGSHNHWILPYLKSNESIFIGWIAQGDYSINRLKKLGVEGPMRWTGSVVQRCIVTKEVGQKLKAMGIDMSTFTEIDSYGKQLSHAGKGI